MIQAGGVALGCSHWTLLVIAIASNAFFFATWETYYTGSMYLGVINGPTEGLLITIATLIISGIYGPLVWKLPLKTILPTSVLNYFTQLKVIASSLTLAQAAIFGMLAMFLTIQLPVCLYRVYVACKRKNISFVQPLLQAGIFIVFLLIATAWTFAPTTTLIPAHVIVYSLAWGLAAGKINVFIGFVSRIISILGLDYSLSCYPCRLSNLLFPDCSIRSWIIHILGTISL